MNLRFVHSAHAVCTGWTLSSIQNPPFSGSPAGEISSLWKVVFRSAARHSAMQIWAPAVPPAHLAATCVSDATNLLPDVNCGHAPKRSKPVWASRFGAEQEKKDEEENLSGEVRLRHPG